MVKLLRSSGQQGFMLLEAIVVATVLLSLINLGTRYFTRDAERTVNQITAKQLQQITQAAQQYVQDHCTDFKDYYEEPNIVKKLIDAGYLSETFRDKNHYIQNYQMIVNQEKVRWPIKWILSRGLSYWPQGSYRKKF